MDRFKHAIFPALILLILLIALLYRLSSCASNSGGASQPSARASASGDVTASAAPSASQPASASPSPAASAKQVVNYTNDDIIRYYRNKGFDAKEIRDAGSATVVMYMSHDLTGDAPLSFAWFDRTTGARDVVVAGVLAGKFAITADKRLTVLTTGRNYANGKQWFPELITSESGSGAEAPRYFSGAYPYFMPVSQSFTVSDDRAESVRRITFDYDGVSVGFIPQRGREAEFEVAYRYIPKTNVVCSSGYCYVTFYNTTLSEDFVAPEEGAGDGLRTFVSVKCDGTNTFLTMKLGTRTTRYNVSMGYSPDDGMPYAVLKFRGGDGIFPSYPAGW